MRMVGAEEEFFGETDATVMLDAQQQQQSAGLSTLVADSKELGVTARASKRCEIFVDFQQVSGRSALLLVCC